MSILKEFTNLSKKASVVVYIVHIFLSNVNISCKIVTFHNFFDTIYSDVDF